MSGFLRRLAFLILAVPFMFFSVVGWIFTGRDSFILMDRFANWAMK